jgi:urease accessory protein
MTPGQFVQTLQVVDSLFPVGSFAYSDGLESAVSNGCVRDSESLAGWLDHYIDAVFAPCEGLALLKCMRAAKRGDWEVVRALDEELSAIKPSAATRTASASIGKRLLAAVAALRHNQRFPSEAEALPESNAPVVYAIVFAADGLNETDALLAYGYARLAAMISAGMRLISLGHQQGQVLLSRGLARLPAVVRCIIENEAEPLRSFNPMLDIQQMNHRFIYSRLFRS